MLDAFTSFGLIITLIILFLPFTINEHHQYRNELNNAEMNRILLTSLYRFNTKELQKGVEIANYTVKYNHEKICIFDNKTKVFYCLQK